MSVFQLIWVATLIALLASMKVAHGSASPAALDDAEGHDIEVDISEMWAFQLPSVVCVDVQYMWFELAFLLSTCLPSSCPPRIYAFLDGVLLSRSVPAETAEAARAAITSAIGATELEIDRFVRWLTCHHVNTTCRAHPWPP